MTEVEEEDRAALIARIHALAPSLLPTEPKDTTAQLRQLLAGIEDQRAWFREAGFVDEAK